MDAPQLGPLLETRDVVKRFGGTVAVNGLSLVLARGEIRGLIGPNGSGKTTTVNILTGLHRPDAGEIRLDGRPVDRLRPHQIAARGVARTFQIPKLFGNMTVLENVLLPGYAERARAGARPMREIREHARRLLDFVTLDGHRHALAKQLSGGQAMLAQIARALMVHPLHVVLMDEPFAGVHPSIRQVIMEAILRMNRESAVTFLVVSHEMAEVRRLCRIVSVMHEGRLIAEGPLARLAEDPVVLEAYLGR
jgi:branched-chain amino acid transport system ATP-binding protein